MNHSPTSRWPLIVAFAIPLILLAVLSIAVYLPRTTVRPGHNFLYTTDTDYSYDGRFQVVNQQLSYTPVPSPSPDPSYPSYPRNHKPAVYLYDVMTDQSRKLSETEYGALKVSDQPFSPDGYQVKSDDSNNSVEIFPFFLGGGYQGDVVVITGKGGKRKIDLVDGGRGYYDFRFLGWVLP